MRSLQRTILSRVWTVLGDGYALTQPTRFTIVVFLQKMRELMPSGRVARNTYVGTAWLALRVSGQAAWIVALGRAIGPSGYGLFSGLAGLAAALGTLSGLGFGVLLLQDGSRDTSRFSAGWKRSLFMTVLSGAVLWLAYVLLAPMLLHEHGSLSMYVAIGLVELVCFPLTVTASYAFQVHERMGWASAVHTLVPMGNLLAAGMFISFDSDRTLVSYLPYHAMMGVLSALVSIALVRKVLSPGATRFSVSFRDLKEGLAFSTMRVADTGLTSLDKTLVLLLSSSSIAGIYSSAYRLITVITMPITSLSMAVLPRLFRMSDDVSTRAERRTLVRRLAIAVSGYGVLAGFATWLLSGMLPMLLGEAFRPAAQAARWLVISPFLYCFYTLGCNVLVTSNRRSMRVASQCAGILILALSANLLVPKYGLKGAVGMLLITQAFTTAILWTSILYSARMNRRTKLR